MAASPTCVPLATAIPAHLNVQPTQLDSSRKRKRSIQSDASTSVVTFFVEAVAHQKPESAVFAHVTTINRTQLPLSWLCPFSATGQPPAGYIFRTEFPLPRTEPSIAVARLQPNGGLYAIEVAAEGVFTAWPLSNWVTEEICHGVRRGAHTTPDLDQLYSQGGGHSRAASTNSETTTVALAPPTRPKKAKHRRGAMARMAILTPHASSDTDRHSDPSANPSNLVASPFSLENASELDMSALQPLPAIAEREIHGKSPNVIQSSEPGIEDQQNGQTQLSNGLADPPLAVRPTLDLGQVVKQYLETLYLSKASLAFYSKGPLSRARAQARSPSAEVDLETLKDWYLSMILPTKKIDLKYKETVSNTMKNQLIQAQNGQGEKKPHRRKAATTRIKLGKDCLYPDENESVEKWWASRDVETGSKTNADDSNNMMHKAISELRNRETAMQLLLILEVIYLEQQLSKATEATEAKRTSSDVDIKIEGVHGTAPVKPTRPAKKRNLISELDTVAERLSIWHSVAIDDILSSPARAGEDNREAETKSRDRLRDFCRDVIIPFYGAKLPEQTKSICRKLGGPGMSSKGAKSTTSKENHKSGVAVVSLPKTRPTTKRSLERVLSEDHMGHRGSPPILSWSWTAPLVPKLKREPSETNGRPLSRSAIEKSVSFSNREIDLAADAQALEAKRRKVEKLTSQKRELAEAIDALKKPNRTSAGKAFMDEIEKRNVDTKSATKSLERPVHIVATPQRSKSKLKVSQSTRDQPLSLSAGGVDSEPVIPASVIKPTRTETIISIPQSSKKKVAVLDAIHETPSRGLSRSVDLFSAAIVEATPALVRVSSLTANSPVTITPLPQRLIANTKSGKQVLFTPVKRRDVHDQDGFAFKDVPEIPEKAGQAMDRVMGGKARGMDVEYDGEAVHGIGAVRQHTDVNSGSSWSRGSTGPGPAAQRVERSIYEQLGWDDYNDI